MLLKIKKKNMINSRIKLFIALVAGPFIALTLTGLTSIFINTVGDPMIITGVALESPDIRPLSEIMTTCILAPIPLWSFVGLILFMISER
jgi:hypothetical protein